MTTNAVNPVNSMNLVDYPHLACVHRLFEAQVERTPEAVAVVLPGMASPHSQSQSLTYRQLNNRANQLARYLQSLGVAPDVLVAVSLERSLEMTIAILGTLKAGGAYVPLDPAYPQDRRAYMLADTQAPVILTQASLVADLPAHQATVVCLDTDWQSISHNDPNSDPNHDPNHDSNNALGHDPSNPTSTVGLEHLAYVIYTSGSTGKPKGVALGQHALANLICWQLEQSPLGVGDRTLQFASLSFDVSFQEMFATWCSGGTLVLISEELRRDALKLLAVINQEAIARLFLPFIALQQLAEAVQSSGQVPHSLREVMTAGEQLQISPYLVSLFSQIPHCTLHNQYGPSESHVVTAFTLTGAPQDWPALPPIGTAIANTQVYLLDEQMQPVPSGEEGELYIGGVCLARGYLNRPDLTSERFVTNPFAPATAEASQVASDRLYKTGDIARCLPDGNIQYIGRIDHQVKIRGFRIEIGEIETALMTHPAVKQAVVVAREDQPGNKRLVAYLVLNEGQSFVIGDLQDYLLLTLPDYMVPSLFMPVDALPKTPSGKIDRRALPMPTVQRSLLSQAYTAPTSELETVLSEIWSAVLGVAEVGIQDNFFELGGNSLLTLQVVTQIQQRLNRDISVVKLFQYPTIAQLTTFLSLDPQSPVQDEPSYKRPYAHHPNRTNSAGVAIIGMAGRFPGAMTVDHLWQNLCNGVESITFFRDDELDPTVDPALKQLPNYIRAKGVMADADKFDAAFFGTNPREAEVMDPQQRVFLEIAWAALEHAGYAVDTFPGLVGVYVGTGNNTYYPNNVATRRDLINQLGEFQVMTVNEKDYVATRVSYKLNLRGPSLSIHTACSTSLVAVSEAFHALMGDRCDMALAGGISIAIPQNTGYLYQEGAMLSGDGHCRPFDAHAAGTIFSSGAGVVVLKRLEDALADGDQIYAVIKGAATNNDGADKMSFAAPSVAGQAGAIAMAQAYADFHPETITYVEAHGTATPLGDPIEIEALSQVFRAKTDAKQFCAIGSIKSNFGHLTAAAGIAGLIKTTLALKHQVIPPTLHYQNPNPRIDFANSPFFVNAQLQAWQAGATPRRAGVSSFGVGGTNAYVVLEEPPQLPASSPSRPYQLLLLSAKTATALDVATSNLKQYLAEHTDLNLADVAFTLQVGRKDFSQRRFVVCRDRADAVQAMETLPPQQSATRSTSSRNPEVVFMFPGQGAQYINMGLNLYQQEPLFRETVDRCAEILLPHLGRDLREVLYPQSGGEEAATEILRNTFFTQPALFTIGYALAQVWISWGITPSGMIGHSIGEFVAACLAGVFSLDDALRLVATRGRLMQELPSGAMLSVRAPASAVEPWLTGDLAIAAVNAPNLCVVSGPTSVIAALQQTLEAQEIAAKPLHTSHAFHSPMMDPIVAPFAAVVREVVLHPPQLPFVSTVTADWITPEQATDPLYWANHLRATVRFADGIQTLWQVPSRVLLEVGPRTTTATLARRQAQDLKTQIVISSLSDTAENQAEWESLLQAVGQLWLAGATIDWQSFYAHETRHRIPLPTYPFDRKRFWVDPAPQPQPSSLNPPALPPQAQPSDPLFPSSPIQPIGATMPTTQMMPTVQSRAQRLMPLLKEIVEETSGLELADTDESATFLELGLDSLTLTQVGLALQKRFNVQVTFRQLLKELPNLVALADFMDRQLPADAFPAEPAPPEAIATPPVPVAPTPQLSTPSPSPVLQSVPAPAIAPTPYPPVLAAPQPVATSSSALEAVINQQLYVMARQLELLSGGSSAGYGAMTPQAIPSQLAQPVSTPQPAVTPVAPSLAVAYGSSQEAVQSSSPALAQSPSPQPSNPAPEEAPKKTFGAGARIDTSERESLTSKQKASLEAFIRDYTTRTGKSKQYTQANRAHLADPRAVSGFNRVLKELVYPIVTVKSSGSKLWDMDGNEYVDMTCGFGSNFFGNQAPFIVEAIAEQMQRGYEIGPQSAIAGDVAQLFCELTKMERAAFCTTGSEAVLGAMRVARTVTGRNTIVMFTGDYHGIVDEVIVRGTKKLKSLPAAPGIPTSAVENVLVLDYGEPESLEILKARADEFAAIMVEPVQSRRPDLQPREFLHQVQAIANRSGAAFIMDEVITGFRIHPGGAQAHFGLEADLGTYGKIVGGGLPIGVIAGKRKFMDALDGGFWQFGDDSFPEVGVTYFAGTFVRHPLSMAAAKVVLQRLKQEGPDLQRSLNQKADYLAATLNTLFQQHQAPFTIANFGSLFKLNYASDFPHGELLYYWLRHHGLHIWDHRPCFLTLAHTNEDIAFIINAFKQSWMDMRAAGFLPELVETSSTNNGIHYHNGHGNGHGNGKAATCWSANKPPMPGARLGRDLQGNPAWFVPDPDRPGKFLQVI